MRLERVSAGLTEAIRVSTRQRQREFSMFLNLDETFGVIGQLADIALRRLLDSEGLELDRVLQQPTRITKRSVLALLQRESGTVELSCKCVLEQMLAKIWLTISHSATKWKFLYSLVLRHKYLNVGRSLDTWHNSIHLLKCQSN